MADSLFTILNAVNVSDKTEKKNGLTYLSWAWAWGEIKKVVPDATYTIYERETDHGPVNYFTDGRTAWVKTGVTLNGLEHIEELPVMNFKNQSIPLDSITSMDVNKTIQRSLTKACARHGLGLYIYAGEDLPEEEAAQAAQEVGQKKLASLSEKINAAAAPSPKKMATPTQVQYIMERADEKNKFEAMKAFGPDLERMSFNQANQLIQRIKEATT